MHGTNNQCKQMHEAKAEPTCALADDCALLEGVIDALNAVTLAADEEAAAELGAGCAGVEQCWGCVCEPALTAAHEQHTGTHVLQGAGTQFQRGQLPGSQQLPTCSIRTMLSVLPALESAAFGASAAQTATSQPCASHHPSVVSPRQCPTLRHGP